MSETRAPKAPPIYRAENARRIMAGHLSNFYRELIEIDECVRNLDALATHAHAGGDAELRRMALALANELLEGKQPALIFPTLPIAAVFSPEAAEAAEREAELLEVAMTAPENAREARAIAEAELERDHGEADRGMRGESTGEADRGKRDAPVEEDDVDTAPPRRRLKGSGKPLFGKPRATPKRSSAQCRGKTKKGERCKANAVEGSKFCRAHDDQSS